MMSRKCLCSIIVLLLCVMSTWGEDDIPRLSDYSLDSSSALLIRERIQGEENKRLFDEFYNNVLNYSEESEMYWLSKMEELQEENGQFREIAENDKRTMSEMEKRLGESMMLSKSLKRDNELLNDSMNSLKHMRNINTLKVGLVGFGIGVGVTVPAMIGVMSKIK